MLPEQTEFTPGIAESVILSRVHAFVSEDSLYRQNGFGLGENEKFFEKAALDSKYVLAMINFVEQEFGVIVSNCEICDDNLGSLRAVSRFVANKQPFAVG